MLEAVGVTPQEERMYRALLEHPEWSVAELSRVCATTRPRAAKVLASLEEKGLVSRSAGPRVRFVPSPPDIAVEALIARRQEELERTRLDAAQLLDAFRNSRVSADPIIEILRGHAIVQRVDQLMMTSKDEVLGFDTPPYGAGPAKSDIEIELLSRGVRFRILYDQAALAFPGNLDVIQEHMRAGEEARAVAHLPLKLGIADRRLAILPLQPEESGPTEAVVVHDSSMLRALTTLFDVLWERAVPIRFRGGALEDRMPPSGPSSADEVLIALMATGMPDRAIARQMGVGLRTVERRITKLMKMMGAQSRFQAALQAAQLGWIGGQTAPVARKARGNS